MLKVLSDSTVMLDIATKLQHAALNLPKNSKRRTMIRNIFYIYFQYYFYIFYVRLTFFIKMYNSKLILLEVKSEEGRV